MIECHQFSHAPSHTKSRAFRALLASPTSKLELKNWREARLGRPKRTGATIRSTPRENEASVGKLRALWISAWNLGLVRSHQMADLWSWLALAGFGDQVRIVENAGLLRRAITHLKNWIAHEGQVDWRYPVPKEAIARAQYRRLLALQAVEGERLASSHGFSEATQELTGVQGIARYTESDWHDLTTQFGQKIRALIQAKAQSRNKLRPR